MKWRGLDEFRADLQKIPEHLKGEATAYVEQAVQEAYREAYARYPVGPGTSKRPGGNLRKGLRIVEVATGPYGVARRLRNVAPHALIFERGTGPRRTATPNRFVGSMPPGNVFIPAAISARRRMVRNIAALLTRTGFRLSAAA